MNMKRSGWLAWVGAGVLVLAAAGAWQFLRPQFYGERAIGEVDEAFMRIDAPGSTPADALRNTRELAQLADWTAEADKVLVF